MAKAAKKTSGTGKKAMQAPIKPGRVYSPPSGSKKTAKKGSC